MFATIQGLEETILNYTRDNQVANGQKWKENNGENHFHVRPRNKSKEAHEHQLGQLASGELVDFALRNSTDVVVGRISGLLREEESNALKHLIAAESSDGHVKEKTIENGRWDVGQRVRQQQDRQADEDVGEKDRQSSLSHSNKTTEWQIKSNLLGIDAKREILKVLHLIDVTLMNSFLSIGQCAGVQWRMRNKSVHPRQPDSW